MMDEARLKKRITRPFPGLRPFEHHEAEIFFGRAVQIDDMIRRLEDHRFLTIIGASGCGKSSLVRAGLLPALEEGELFLAGDRWQMVVMRPGETPFRNLARAFRDSIPEAAPGDAAAKKHEKEASTNGRTVSRGSKDLSFTEDVLHRGPLGFVEAIEDARVSKDTNVLLLVDQFEELFRFRHPEMADVNTEVEQKCRVEQQRLEANEFVNLLITTARQNRREIYVVLTMRSDFLGDCNAFYGLPEAINESQFLTPRLNQDQIHEAIIGPLQRFNATAETGLISCIVGDIGGEADQLPLMQHTLMRMWNRATDPDDARVRGGQTKPPPRIMVTLRDYKEIGGLSQALSNHAEETFKGLEREDRQCAQILFRTLTKGESGRGDTRRPTRFKTVVDIVAAGKSTKEARARVKNVVNAFRRGDRCFVTPPERAPLEDEDVLDISHESLIRQWHRLKRWAKNEAAATEAYRELIPPSRRWEKKEKGFWKALSGLWRGQDLRRATKWQKEVSPAWGALHGEDFGAVDAFINAGRVRNRFVYAFYIGLIFLLFGLVIFYQNKQAAFQKKMEIEKAEAAIIKESVEREKNLRSEAESLRDEAIFLKNEATSLKENAMREDSKYRATLSFQETFASNATSGMILALDALPGEGRDRPYVPLAERALYAALHSPHEIAILEGHKHEIEHGAFSPDGKWAVTGSWDQTARLWSLDQASSYTLEGHTGAVKHVSFNPDGDLIVTASGDKTARVWKTESREPVSILRGHEGMVSRASFSPGGDLVLTASSDFSACIWDARTGVRIHQLTGHSFALTGAVFSPDGARVLTACWGGSVRIWDAETGDQLNVLDGHEKAVRHAAYSPDGNFIVTASEDKTARLWDASTGDLRQVLTGHEKGVLHAAFNPRGDRVATASRDATARLWDVETGEPISELRGHGDKVHLAVFSPDGQRVLTASNDKTACLWDADTGKLIYRMRRHTGWINHAAFSHTGDRVLTMSEDKTARIWNSKRLLLRGHADPIEHAAFSPKGDLIVTESLGSNVRIWNAETGLQTRLDEINERLEVPVLHLSLKSSGAARMITAYKNNTANVWYLSSEVEIHLLRGHKNEVVHATFNPKGDRIATASRDGTARIWDAENGSRKHVLSGHTDEVTHVDFSPRGDLVVTASKDGTARVWDAETGKIIHALSGHEGAVSHAVFSHGGDLVATASGDKTVRLWNAKTGVLFHTLTGHGSGVLQTSFNPLGTRLIAVSGDNTALLWKIGNSEEKTAFEEKASSPPETNIASFPEEMDIGLDFFLLRHDETILQAMFSPVGDRIVTSSEDGTAIVWDAIDGEKVATLKEHGSPVGVALFSPDGKRVLTADKDGLARVWEVFPTTEALVKHARGVIKGKRLTREEERRIFPY